VVIFGKTSEWADIDLASFTSGSAGFWIWGGASVDQFGVEVRGAGDVNGDGIDDVIGGANAADSPSRAEAGIAYVVFGHNSTTAFATVDLSGFSTGSAGFKVLGAAVGDFSGNTVSGAGDFNGDGYGDIIVGAIYYDGPGGTDSGAVYVIFGHSTTTAFADIDLAALSSSQGFRITGAAANDRLSRSLSSAGDFNHDGYGDIVVASNSNKAYILFGHSSATAFSNVDLAMFSAGAAGFIVTGSGDLGFSVAGGTDINGDGVDDVLVTAPSASGTGVLYVLYGRSQLQFFNIDVQTGLPKVSGFRIVGPTVLTIAEWSVSLVKDYDGDGVGDILLGARFADPSGREDAGAVYLVYGELSAPTSQPSRQPSGQPTRHPSPQPSVQPSRQPTSQPSRQPTMQPSRQPSVRPTSSPVSERSGDVELSTWSKPRRGFEVWGAAVEDNLGCSVADAGDVNKDGYHDILLGASTTDVAGKQNAGVVYLVFGSGGRSTSVIDTASALSPKGIKILGAYAGDLWGLSASGAGDFNKDGIDDLIVGGYGFDPPSVTGAGAAVVIFGKTSGWADIDLASFISGSAGFWIYGAATDDITGSSVSAAGDINGDGAGDVIIGAPQANAPGKADSGVSVVLFGHSTATAFNTIDLANFYSGTSGFKILGATFNDVSGNSVSSAGDVNGDGFGDVIIGGWLYDGSAGDRNNCGAAYVIFGHSAATAFTDIDLAALSNSQGFRITGAAAGDHLSYSMSSAGDFNHDGYDDIVVGSTVNKAYVLFGHLNTVLFPNVDLSTLSASTVGFMVTGGGDFATSIRGGVDVNGDGVHDIVFAAPTYATTGAAYVLYGRSQLRNANIDLVSGLPGVSGFKIVGAASTTSSEWSAGLVKDFDGDGVGEIIIGARYADPTGRTDAGVAYLIYGELSAPTSQPSGQPTIQPSRQPTVQPSRQPTLQPGSFPSRQPTTQPSEHPSSQPTTRPSVSPVQSLRSNQHNNPLRSHRVVQLGSQPDSRRRPPPDNPLLSPQRCHPDSHRHSPVVNHPGSLQLVQVDSRPVNLRYCQVRGLLSSPRHSPPGDPALSRRASHLRNQCRRPAPNRPLSPVLSRRTNLQLTRADNPPASL
jgi:hypothetical protein